MQALLDQSEPMVELVWRRETEKQVLDSPERRASLEQRLGAHLARIAHPGLRNHWKEEFRRRRDVLFAPPPAPPSRPGRAATGRGAMARRGGPSPARAAALLASPAPATRASLLGRPAGGLPAEARIRESAILMGCLSHPEIALAVEDRLERLAFSCPDSSARFATPSCSRWPSP